MKRYRLHSYICTKEMNALSEHIHNFQTEKKDKILHRRRMQKISIKLAIKT